MGEGGAAGSLAEGRRCATVCVSRSLRVIDSLTTECRRPQSIAAGLPTPRSAGSLLAVVVKHRPKIQWRGWGDDEQCLFDLPFPVPCLCPPPLSAGKRSVSLFCRLCCTKRTQIPPERAYTRTSVKPHADVCALPAHCQPALAHAGPAPAPSIQSSVLQSYLCEGTSIVTFLEDHAGSYNIYPSVYNLTTNTSIRGLRVHPDASHPSLAPQHLPSAPPSIWLAPPPTHSSTASIIQKHIAQDLFHSSLQRPPPRQSGHHTRVLSEPRHLHTQRRRHQ